MWNRCYHDCVGEDADYVDILLFNYYRNVLQEQISDFRFRIGADIVKVCLIPHAHLLLLVPTLLPVPCNTLSELAYLA